LGREPIPEELRRFILTSVRSVPFVEALLLCRGARGTALAVQDIAKRLYISEKNASDLVQEVLSAGMLERVADKPGCFRYAPASPELAAMVDMLASFYATHLVDVTRLIHSVGTRRAMQFADAFKLRRDS
jgi:hypothetical protein